jgi:hypothetical protein
VKINKPVRSARATEPPSPSRRCSSGHPSSPRRRLWTPTLPGGGRLWTPTCCKGAGTGHAPVPLMKLLQFTHELVARLISHAEARSPSGQRLQRPVGEFWTPTVPETPHVDTHRPRVPFVDTHPPRGAACGHPPALNGRAQVARRISHAEARSPSGQRLQRPVGEFWTPTVPETPHVDTHRPRSAACGHPSSPRRRL